MTEVIQRSNGGKLTFGLLLALYAGSSGTTQLMSTLNFAYQVRETRSWIKVRLISLALTLVISMLIIVASLLVLAGGYVAEFLGREIGLSSIVIAGWKALQWIMSIGFVLMACAVVYYFAPDLKSRRWHWITPGSVIGVALWLMASGVVPGIGFIKMRRFHPSRPVRPAAWSHPCHSKEERQVASRGVEIPACLGIL